MTNLLKYENPEILKKYGKNWQPFEDILNQNLEFLTKKTYSLFDINNVSSMSEEIINYELDANNIPVIVDNINAKKSARRKYVSNYKIKGDPDVYLDIAESIVGIRGEIFSGDQIAAWIWDESTWPEGGGFQEDSLSWPGNFPYLEVWINVKTNDTILLDRILSVYRSPIYRPAFLQIYLTDDSLGILGVV